MEDKITGKRSLGKQWRDTNKNANREDDEKVIMAENFLLSADEVMELYLFLRTHILNHTESTSIPCTSAKNLVILLFCFSDADLKALQYSENLKNWQNPQTWWEIQSSAVNGLGQCQRAASCHP